MKKKRVLRPRLLLNQQRGIKTEHLFSTRNHYRLLPGLLVAGEVIAEGIAFCYEPCGKRREREMDRWPRQAREHIIPFDRIGPGKLGNGQRRLRFYGGEIQVETKIRDIIALMPPHL